MAEIIGFKRFENEEAFIEWQKEAPRHVHTVMPMINHMTYDNEWNDSTCRESAIAAYTVGAFVTYIIDEPATFIREA